MKSNSFLSPDPKRITTFTKNTNRKYFGAPSNVDTDMKKSSILLNYTSKEDSSRLFGSKSPQLRNADSYQPLYQTQNHNDKKDKTGGMYSSMIVKKSDDYQKPSALASNDKLKQLNDWADELKKKLTPFLDQPNKSIRRQDDLLNKYAPLPTVKEQINKSKTPLNAFAKSKPANQKQITNYSNFSDHVKTITTNSNFQKPKNFQSIQNTNYSNTTFKKYSQPSYSNFSTTSNSFVSSSQNNRTNQPKKLIVITDFQMGKKLGNGMFGEVFLVRHKTLGFVCAMKILKKSLVKQQKVQQQLVRQIKIQFFLQHQNVVNLYGFFSDSQCVYLLQQLCMDGHLFSMLKQKQKFQDNEAADIIKQICLGLDYIHRQKIIHRDIKPQNIIIHQGVAKICDFGWGVYRGDGLRSTFCGTPLYTPPQLLKGQMYDEKFDVWAVGILAYELIVGRFPFKIFSEDDLNRILTDQITFPFSVDVTPDAKNFILSIIHKDPRDRIQIDEILSHSFLRKNFLAPYVIDFKI